MQPFIFSDSFLTAGVHSHITHLFGLLELAKREGLEKSIRSLFSWTEEIRLLQEAKGYIQELNDKMKELGVGQVASVMGRYYAMDRDNRWDRGGRLAYKALTKGEGIQARVPGMRCKSFL